MIEGSDDIYRTGAGYSSEFSLPLYYSLYEEVSDTCKGKRRTSGLKLVCSCLADVVVFSVLSCRLVN